MECLSCGVDLHAVPNILEALEDARADKFDFACIPLAHPRYNRDSTGLGERAGPWTRSDLLLNSGTWSSVVVGKVSHWIDLDSVDEEISYNSRKVRKALLFPCNCLQAFKQEIAWASHLSLPAILLPPPTQNSVNYAQCINQSLLGLTAMQVWLQVPLVPSHVMLATSEVWHPVSAQSHNVTLTPHKVAPNAQKNEPWMWWNTVRMLCEHHHNLGVGMFGSPCQVAPTKREHSIGGYCRYAR